MSIRLLKALTGHYELVELATKDPATDVPSELNFVPGSGDDLESMIWVLTYAIMLRHHGNLQAPRKAFYKSHVVDIFYGTLSYSALAEKRQILMICGAIPDASEPERWFPDPAQCKWFRGAMELVENQMKRIRPITFDTFDELCDGFITNE